MLCPIQDQRRGEWEKWGTGSVVWKECRPTSETKEAAAALNVPVVCPSPKPQTKPHFPPLAFMLQTATRYRRREIIAISLLLEARSWGLGRKLPFGPGFSPLPVLTTPSSAVRFGVGDINPEQRSLEARNKRAEPGCAITSETRPNASLRPTTAHRLLIFLDESFRPKRE